MEDGMNVFKFLVGKYIGKIPLVNLSVDETDLKEIGVSVVE